MQRIVRVLVTVSVVLLSALSSMAECPTSSAFVAQKLTGELSLVDFATGGVSPIAAGLVAPEQIAINASQSTIYVVEFTSNGRLVAVDLATGNTTDAATGLARPVGVAVNADESAAFVSENGAGRLSAVDLGTGLVTPLTGSVLSGPAGIALNPAETTLFIVENGSGELSAVDLTTGIITTIAGGLGAPVHVVLNDAGTIAYVTEDVGGEISAIDVATGSVTTVASGLFRPGYLFLNDSGTKVFVAEFAVATGTITEVDLATGSSLLIAGGLDAPTGLVVCPSDADGDGIVDAEDLCPGTVIPELVPTIALGVNRWALVDGGTTFDTTPNPGNGGGPGLSFSVADTAGCSCEQVIDRLGLGKGHRKFGCSSGAIEDWIASINGEE